VFGWPVQSTTATSATQALNTALPSGPLQKPKASVLSLVALQLIARRKLVAARISGNDDLPIKIQLNGQFKN
jgi:hypothetical protein